MVKKNIIKSQKKLTEEQSEVEPEINPQREREELGKEKPKAEYISWFSKDWENFMGRFRKDWWKDRDRKGAEFLWISVFSIFPGRNRQKNDRKIV